MIINGKPTQGRGKEKLDIYNPATMKIIDSVPYATEADIEDALDAAKIGTEKWRKIPLFERIEIFSKFTDLVKESMDEFCRLMSSETGKPLSNCKDETETLIYIFRLYAEKARNYGGETLPLNSDPRVLDDIVFTIREPLGVVAAVVPFNYPTELFAHKVAPALITGNSVIVKPSSDTPLGNIYLTKLLLEAGVTPEAIQIVTGSGSKIGAQLASSPKVDAISLTGSTRVGIDTMQNAAKNLTHVSLELGGNDPIIIFDDADLDLAIDEILLGRASNGGQTCCATKRILVQNGVKEKLTEKLLEALKNLKVGDPLEEGTFYGPLINENAAKDVEKQVEKTIQQGAKCILGGKRFNTTFFEPTLLVDVTADMDVSKDMEIFGPVFPIIGFDTADEAIAIANSSPFGLSSGVMTKDISVALKVATKIEAGTCVINGCGNYRGAHQAFGGYKMTGIGREGVAYTLDEFTQVKSIVLKKMIGE